MTKEEILNALEEVLDVAPNSLSVDMNLSDIDEYDSMARLSVIVLADDDFAKKLSGEQMRAFVTVGDIVDFLSA